MITRTFLCTCGGGQQSVRNGHINAPACNDAVTRSLAAHYVGPDELSKSTSKHCTVRWAPSWVLGTATPNHLCCCVTAAPVFERDKAATWGIDSLSPAQQIYLLAGRQCSVFILCAGCLPLECLVKLLLFCQNVPTCQRYTARSSCASSAAAGRKKENIIIIPAVRAHSLENPRK